MILVVGKVQKDYIRQLQQMILHLPMELLQLQLILLKFDKTHFEFYANFFVYKFIMVAIIVETSKFLFETKSLCVGNI